MAEIPVERKSSLKWLWVLLAVLVVIALIWWATDTDDNVEMVETTGELPEATAVAPGMTIADILGNPAAYVGRDDFNAEVTVPTGTQITDRGFWVQDQGAQLFALINDEPREQPKDINPGQRLQITNGMLRDATFISQIPGDLLDADTQSILEQQDVFLVIDEENIQILAAGNPQQGTDRAQTATPVQ